MTQGGAPTPGWTRRGLGAALVGLARKSEARVPGEFVDGSHAMGHKVRDRQAFGGARQTVEAPVVVVGGGIAGLSAAWRFDKRGFRDYVVVEMEDRAGGNSRWGQNEVTPYPWAAHYVPVPSGTGGLVREIMTDLGVFSGGKWEERYLCHSPQERLFIHGRWQEGLEPETSTAEDRRQAKRFQEMMREFEGSGEFAIPMETGKRRRSDLSRMTMSEWMKAQRFDSETLLWFADYACRDDFGSSLSTTSAWAGIHYHAARGQRDDKGPLTWPEGNGWIVRRLLERVGARLRTGAFVHRIERNRTNWRVFAGPVEYRARAVVFAAPTYLAPYLIAGVPPPGIEYSPWLTANLTVDRWPDETGFAPAWDNVIHRSPSLGYVVATHQSLRTWNPRTVWTYYWPLSSMPPAAARRMLLEKDASYWIEAILTDLETAHPDIRRCVSRVDLMRMGHAMARPSPGHLERTVRDLDGLYFANSDLSGFSLFEEAQYRGVAAADKVLRRISK